MKDSTKYAKKLMATLRSLKKDHAEIKLPTYSDPIEAVIFAVLAEQLKASTARSLLKGIHKHFVDYNDLRVSRVEELLDVLRGDSPQLREVAHTLSKVLNSIFTKFDTVSLMELLELGKRPGHKELEELEGVTPFIVSYCFLTALKGHAIPVNEKMIDYLRDLELVHPKAKLHDIEGFLERQINANNGYECYTLIREAGDKYIKPAPEKKRETKKTAKKKAAVKKTANKKTAAKKTVKGETAAKKPTIKKTVKKKNAAKKKTAKK